MSFQEYLTAEQIRNRRYFEKLVENFDKAWWRETTLLAMGLTNPPIYEDFMQALLRERWRDGARVDFMLRCIDETLVKTEAPFIETLQKTSNDSDARYYSLLGLDRIGTEAGEEAMEAVLDDTDAKVAGAARSILGIEAPGETLTVVIKGEPRQLPRSIFNPVEGKAEYILIPGATEQVIFESTSKPAPDYPVYFAKFPVTNALYRRFINYLAGKGEAEIFTRLPREQFAESLLRHAQAVDGFAEHLSTNPAEWAKKLRSSYDDDKRFNGDDQPVVGVTWYAVVSYCHWLSALSEGEIVYRLPTEEEWEWAAGGGKRLYPWGDDDADENRANFNENVGQTTPVGAYSDGETPEGLMDVGGNVYEWMGNFYREESRHPALRGGGWYSGSAAVRCGARDVFLPSLGNGLVGFRVLRFQS